MYGRLLPVVRNGGSLAGAGSQVEGENLCFLKIDLHLVLVSELKEIFKLLLED